MLLISVRCKKDAAMRRRAASPASHPLTKRERSTSCAPPACPEALGEAGRSAARRTQRAAAKSLLRRPRFELRTKMAAAERFKYRAVCSAKPCSAGGPATPDKQSSGHYWMLVQSEFGPPAWLWLPARATVEDLEARRANKKKSFPGHSLAARARGRSCGAAPLGSSGPARSSVKLAAGSAHCAQRRPGPRLGA